MSTEDVLPKVPIPYEEPRPDKLGSPDTVIVARSLNHAALHEIRQNSLTARLGKSEEPGRLRQSQAQPR
jgi:hypothetical protein